MRENRTCGSEVGEAQSLPYPYPGHRAIVFVGMLDLWFGGEEAGKFASAKQSSALDAYFC